MELLSWDTDFFGFTIARARVPAAEALEPEIAAARDAGVDCLYVFVPEAEASALEAAIRAGSILTALRLVHEKAGDDPPADAKGVRRAGPEDAVRVAEFSRSLAGSSRFAYDPRFPRERIDGMYHTWALNDLREGDVFIPLNGSGGMVTMSSRGDVASIGLVYVEPRARGTGLARELLTAAFARAAGRKVKVATDARNIPALRLYESVGFRAQSLEAILHLWLDARR